MKVTVKIDQASLQQAKEQALNIVAQQAIKGFDTIVGPHLLKAARSKAPVGKREAKNPQRSSFGPIRLVEREEGRFTTQEIDRLRDLRGMSARERAEALVSSDIKFFRGPKRGPNRDRQPDRVDVIRGSIRGAFIHKPGTLRDSHIYVPARRVRPDKVIAEVRATAEYAAAQHEGFDHHSHGKKTGKKVAGRKWLNEALINVASDQRSPNTYKG